MISRLSTAAGSSSELLLNVRNSLLEVRAEQVGMRSRMGLVEAAVEEGLSGFAEEHVQRQVQAKLVDERERMGRVLARLGDSSARDAHRALDSWRAYARDRKAALRRLRESGEQIMRRSLSVAFDRWWLGAEEGFDEKDTLSSSSSS